MAGRVRMRAAGRVRMRAAGGVGRSMPSEPLAVKVATAAVIRMKAVSVYGGSTVGDKRMMVVLNRAVMPVASPVIPTPAVAGK
jgi:hypothetical protein